jgi:GT2 family glycosyltransferase
MTSVSRPSPSLRTLPSGDGADGGGIAVVIVNYRTAELTAVAANSALAEPDVEEVVVVDNASGDGSADGLRAELCDPRVRVVEAPANLGFGRGVNLGVEYCTAPMVLILNSDACVRPGCLRLLVQRLGTGPVGVAAPAVYRSDGVTLQTDAFGRLPDPHRMSLRALPTTRDRRRRADERLPGWVSGVAMLVHRAEFLSLGGFDPGFMMYLEDVDLCRRYGEQGRLVAREPAASVVHLGGGSSTSRVEQVEQFQTSKLVYLQRSGASSARLRLAAALRLLRLLMVRSGAGAAHRSRTAGGRR